MKGYVQVYTGNGKGKTTAALGLALRAAGAGLRVFFGQFVKKGDYGEVKALEKHAEAVTHEQYGTGHFIRGQPSTQEIEAAGRGLVRARAVVADGDFDLVILDEANVAVNLGLITVQDLISVIEERHPNTELVLTGRDAKPEVIARADLVTEMREIKHYFGDGVPARVGIEK